MRYVCEVCVRVRCGEVCVFRVRCGEVCMKCV